MQNHKRNTSGNPLFASMKTSLLLMLIYCRYIPLLTKLIHWMHTDTYFHISVYPHHIETFMGDWRKLILMEHINNSCCFPTNCAIANWNKLLTSNISFTSQQLFLVKIPRCPLNMRLHMILLWEKLPKNRVWTLLSSSGYEKWRQNR